MEHPSKRRPDLKTIASPATPSQTQWHSQNGAIVTSIAAILAATLLAMITGCNSDETKPAATATTANSQTANVKPPQTPPSVAPPPIVQPPPIRHGQPVVAPPSPEESALIFGPEDPEDTLPAKPIFEEGKIQAAGIRRIESKHLILYTDLPPAETIDEFPHVFDLAVPMWCDYFDVDPAKVDDWQMIGCLMDQKNRFAGAGLLPAGLPAFPNGYHRDWQFWVYPKPGNYYTRHLVLHEGTHAFMRAFLGGAGPPWFMEGLAEYLGTHKWENGKLTLGYMPKDNDEVPYWGRVKIIADDFAANRAESLDGVMNFGTQAHLRTEAYAWSWLAVTLLAENPRSSETFKSMFKHVDLGTTAFATKLKSDLGDAWPLLEEEWQLAVVNIDYGYDMLANAIEFGPGQDVPPEGVQIEIDATHGWQSTGYSLRRGQRYKLTGAGQYIVGAEPKPWACEPGGVTIRYHKRRPLGMLLGAVRPGPLAEGKISPLATPGVIGLSSEVVPEVDGVLYASINEHPAEWGDNSGKLILKIEPMN